jgi:alpha-aminoadipate carrier protein LysW
MRCKMPLGAEPVGGGDAGTTAMSHCPECESDLELDGYDLEVGETINCPECSVELRVTSLDPVALKLVEEEG